MPAWMSFIRPYGNRLFCLPDQLALGAKAPPNKISELHTELLRPATITWPPGPVLKPFAPALTMNVRALASMDSMRTRCRRASAIANPHIELQGYCLWRKTGVVVARLVTNLAMNCELARQSGLGGRDQGFHGEFLAVDVQLLFRSEGKADVFSGRIDDSARHDV